MKRLLLTFLFAATTTLAVAAPAPASLPTVRPGSLPVLLGIDTVRKQLGLSSLQRAVLNDIRTEYREDARALVARVSAGKLGKAEGQRQLAALTVASNRRALGALNPSQRVLATKIERQYLGAYALLDPAIQKELALTPRQQKKLGAVWAHYQRAISDVNREFELGKISHNQRILELRDIRYDSSDDLLERLTKPQLAKFNDLTARAL